MAQIKYMQIYSFIQVTDWDPSGKALCYEESSDPGSVRALESFSTWMYEHPGPSMCSLSASYY